MVSLREMIWIALAVAAFTMLAIWIQAVWG